MRLEINMQSVLTDLPDNIKAKLVVSENYLFSINELVHPSDNVLLITSNGFTKRGYVGEIMGQITCNQIHVIDDVTPNPELVYIDSLYEQFAESNISHIIAFGGVSAMDTGKILCGMLEKKRSSVRQMLCQDTDFIGDVSLTAIPTTSGTGAEITPFATVWDSKNGKKHSVVNVQATHVVLCPKLTVVLPYFDTMVTALDALSHAIESLWNANRSARTVSYAQRAITLISDHLLVTLDEPTNLNARAALQNAAFLAGLAISETKTALAHALSYPITLSFNVPHGLACSFTLAPLIKRVGAERLKLTQEQVDTLLTLLNSLKLNEKVAKYAAVSELLDAVDQELDPSRAGNFIISVTPDLVKSVVIESMK